MDKIYDNGPWEVCGWARGIVLASDDFTHDVVLSIEGDFSNNEQKLAYAEGLAEKLNKEIK